MILLSIQLSFMMSNPPVAFLGYGVGQKVTTDPFLNGVSSNRLLHDIA